MGGRRGDGVAEWLAGRSEVAVASSEGLLGAPYAVCAADAERLWLPHLGPTAVLAARNLARRVPAPGDRTVVDLGELAAELGVGPSSARHSPLLRALVRLVDFGVAELHGEVFVVALAWPELPARLARRLPPRLAAEAATSAGPLR